jgi:hypothetical protein
MKFLKLISILILVCFFKNTYAQIISVTENYKGNLRTITKNDKQIIEINSNLEIHISKAKLVEAINKQFPQLKQYQELESKLITLQQALKNQSVVISILEKQLATIEEQKSFFKIMEAFLFEVQANPFLGKRFEDLSAEFFTTEAFANGEVPEPYIFSNLNNDITQIEKELKSIETDKYSVSVMAFKKNKTGGDRVHIQNYDTYSNSEFFTVERWVTGLSNEQKQQLEALSKIARENNAKKLDIFNELKQSLLNEFKSIACITAFKKDSFNFIKTIELNDALPNEVKSKIAELNQLVSKFETLYQILKTDINQWNISILTEIKNELQSVIAHLKSLNTNFSDLKTLISQTPFTAKFTPLAAQFSTCYSTLKQDFEKLQQGVALLFNLQTNYLANKSIGDEIIAFSLDNLPETGFINLKGTGQRQNGDELLIEIVLRTPSHSKESITERITTLEQREFIMQLTGARSEVAVGLIFASPFNKDNLNLQNNRDFFYTPSASLLLKFGSKKSYFYNDFLDFGIGLNFAAPDFNTDGTPEFGTGIITTAFKDIISVGVNYNITLDSMYWFFGINLPFNFPGIPINSVKN